jgi:uncharacterized membrane protein
MADPPTNPEGVKKEQFRLKFKRHTLAGLAALLPILLTLFIVVQIYRWIVPYIVGALGDIISLVLKLVTPQPKPGRTAWGDKVMEIVSNILSSPATQTILSILLAVVILYIVGYIVSSYLGREVFGLLDTLLKRFPVVKVIYPYAKQFTDSIFSNDKTAKFHKVVAIQYPRPGLYALGFLVGTGVKELADRSGRRFATVFIPSSPTPVMGWVALVPEDELIPLSITVDQAFRMIISLGILGPTEAQKPGLPGAAAVMLPRDTPGLPGAGGKTTPPESPS